MRSTRFEATGPLPEEIVDMIMPPTLEADDAAIEEDQPDGGRFSILKSAALWANNIRYKGTEMPDVEAMNEDMPDAVVERLRASLPAGFFTPRGNAHQAVWRLMDTFRGMAAEKRQESSLFDTADAFQRSTVHLRSYPAYAAHQLGVALDKRQEAVASEVYANTLNTKIPHDVATDFFVSELCLTIYDKHPRSSGRLVVFEDAVEAAQMSTEKEFTHLKDMTRELRVVSHAVLIDGGRKYGDIFGAITRIGLSKPQAVRLKELSRMMGQTPESYASIYGRPAWELPSLKDEYRRLSTIGSYGWASAIAIKPHVARLIR